MCFFMFKKIIKDRKWKVYLFYNGICIKKIKMNDYKEIDTIFIRVYGQKKMFGKHIVGLVVKPAKLLKTEEEKKKTYWGVIFEKGVDI